MPFKAHGYNDFGILCAWRLNVQIFAEQSFAVDNYWKYELLSGNWTLSTQFCLNDF